MAEHQALTHRIGRHRQILVNRILSYTVWSTYTAIAGYLVLFLIVPGWSRA